MASRSSLRSKAVRIDILLTDYYGRKEPPMRRPDPLDTLIRTILSQNTSDVNSDRAFDELKKAYPKWDRLLGEDPRRLAEVIRPGGLASIKSIRILDALEFIRSERGTLSLAFLRDMSPSEVDSWLSRIKGVGPKTRAIVLLFSLGKPKFPVDTHIFRVTKRIGLIPRRLSREQAQEALGRLVDESEYYNFHINIIQHGRTICVARRPKCPICPIKRLCQYYRQVFLPSASKSPGQT